MDVNDILNAVESKSKKSNEDVKSSQRNVKSTDQSFDNVMDSISKNWNKNPDKDILTLKKELDEAHTKIRQLESGNHSLGKNADKILAAIRSEKLEQKRNDPLISTNMFRKKYRVHPNYQSKSIESLIDQNIITRKKAKFSGSISSYRYEEV